MGDNTQDLFYGMANSLPYPLTIFKPDGSLAFVNKAWAKMFHVEKPETLFGKYNVLHNPDMKRWGHIGTILKAYDGEVVELHDVKVPLQDMVDKYGDCTVRSEILIQTISCFPIYLNGEATPHVAALYINTKEHCGREAVLKAKEYIRNHWMEEFNMNKLAAAVYTSRYHFARIFKKDVGITPYEYYQSIKIEMIKKKLGDMSLSIADAFVSCGLVYNGSTVTMFKKNVGLTPSQYRKYITEK